MSKNGIAWLPTKEARQLAKLQLAETKRQATGAGYRENRYLDLDLLPTKYVGDAVVNNPNVGGLQVGRPWKTTPNILSGLWRSVYNSYWRGPEYSNLDVSWFDSQTPVSSGAVTTIALALGVTPNTSYQWLGYFRAPNTANYIFTAAGDDSSALWIGPKAITAYTIENADILNITNNDTSSASIALTEGQYYPIRVIYGNGPLGGYFELSWEDDLNIEQLGLVVLLNAASGWGGQTDGTWINDPALSLPEYNGNSLNRPAADTTGGITSMLFNGNSSYWDITNPTSGDFSVGVWFNTTSTAGSFGSYFGNPNIVGSDTGGLANDWGLCMRNGQIGFGGVSGQTAFTTQTFNNGAWHYVVATRVQTTGAMTVFVDGVQLAQITEAPGATLNDTTYIRVAGDPLNDQFWQGRISQVQFYQLALTPVQIASNFDIDRGTYGV
jgi:hypothetical protein